MEACFSCITHSSGEDARCIFCESTHDHSGKTALRAPIPRQVRDFGLKKASIFYIDDPEPALSTVGDKECNPMANTRQSTKRARQAVKRQVRNTTLKSATKTVLRNAIEAIRSTDPAKA